MILSHLSILEYLLENGLANSFVDRLMTSNSNTSMIKVYPFQTFSYIDPSSVRLLLDISVSHQLENFRGDDS